MKETSFNRTSKSWDVVIKPVNSWLNINLREIFKYWDLVILFVKRDFVVFYKQTILGPLWYIIQPLFNTLVFTLVFGKIAKIPTDGIPPFLFYLSGTVVWGYFSLCLNQTGRTFVSNAGIFGKVYFPRIIVPISTTIIAVFQFLIQFLIFLGFYFYFWNNGFEISLNIYALMMLPLIVLHMALMSIGFGLIISAATAKYRDLTFAMGFLVQLWMYLTPVVYPLSEVPDRFKIYILINPMTAVVETFRTAFFNLSTMPLQDLFLSISITIFVFFTGIIVFSRVEKTFMDTV